MYRLLWRKICDGLWPRLCLGCGKSGKYLCLFCRVYKLDKYYQQQCHVCRANVYSGYVHLDCREYSYLDGLIVVGVYQNLLERMIRLVKYNFTFDLVEELAELLSLKLTESYMPRNTVLTWVPSTRQRLWWRGFNQAELLAKELANNSAITSRSLLLRQDMSKSQTKLNKLDRRLNIQGVFRINRDVNFAGAGDNVIIVDDVFTTGATLEECSKILKQNGTREVYGLVLARG